MFTRSLLCAALALFAIGHAANADSPSRVVELGTLESVDARNAQAQAQKWLQSTGKAVDKKAVAAIWSGENRTVLNRISDTLVLGSPEAAKLLQDAANPLVPAPTKIPALLTNKNADSFFRNHLALAYAQHLSHRRVFEQALAALETTKAEAVVDPGSYLFYRAVCEHGLQQRIEAKGSITRLMEQVVDAPERYRTVSILMLLDMQSWQTQDLGAVGRLMKDSERRLRLARANGDTQQVQKTIIRRLDELIKRMENTGNGKRPVCGIPGLPGIPNAGGCPDGSCRKPGPNGPGTKPGPGGNVPAETSNVSRVEGTGVVDQKKVRNFTENWGNMDRRERARALQELTQGLSERHREAIESYFRNLARRSGPY